MRESTFTLCYSINTTWWRLDEVLLSIGWLFNNIEPHPFWFLFEVLLVVKRSDNHQH
jgi:hypothetical protein